MTTSDLLSPAVPPEADPHSSSTPVQTTTAQPGTNPIRSPDLLLACVNDAVIALDPSLRIQFWNRAAEQLYGWSAAEAVGQPLQAIIPETRYLDGSTVETIQECLSHDGHWAGEITQPHRNGHALAIESAVQLLNDQDGHPIGTVAINRDIRARKQMEQAHLAMEEQMQAAIRSKQETLAMLDTLFSDAPIGRAFLDTELRYVRINQALAAINGLPIEAHIGHSAIELFPKLAPLLTSIRDQIRDTGMPIIDLEISFPSADPAVSSHHYLSSYYPIAIDTTGLIGIGVVVIDITERKKTEEQIRHLYEIEHEARHIAEILHAANQAFTRTLKFDSILEVFLEYLLQLIPYDHASILLFEEDEPQFVVHTTNRQCSAEDCGVVKGTTINFNVNPAIAALISTKTSALISDTTTHPLWQKQDKLTAAVGSWLGIPILSGERLIGICSLEKHQRSFFGQQHHQRAECLRVQTSVALQNAQLFSEVRASRERLQQLSRRLVLIQEEERAHIARELHDEIGQVLTGLNLLLESGTRLSHDLLIQRMRQAQALVNELTKQVRELSLDLRPAMLDDLGLLPALHWYVKRYTEQTNVQVQLRYNELERRFPADIEITVYRIVQESLTNIARYAEVSEAFVHLWTADELIGLQIEDHGCGFDVQAIQKRYTSSGIAGMRERALLIGGYLTVDSAVGSGTCISAELPIKGYIDRRKVPR